eukprot:gene19294-23064_t
MNVDKIEDQQLLLAEAARALERREGFLVSGKNAKLAISCLPAMARSKTTAVELETHLEAERQRRLREHTNLKRAKPGATRQNQEKTGIPTRVAVEYKAAGIAARVVVESAAGIATWVVVESAAGIATRERAQMGLVPVTELSRLVEGALQVGKDGSLSVDLDKLLADSDMGEEDEAVGPVGASGLRVKQSGKLHPDLERESARSGKERRRSKSDAAERMSFFIGDTGAMTAEDMMSEFDEHEFEDPAEEEGAMRYGQFHMSRQQLQGSSTHVNAEGPPSGLGRNRVGSGSRAARGWKKAKAALGFTKELMQSVQRVSSLLSEKGAEVEADGRVSFDLADLLADSDEDEQAQEESQDEALLADLGGRPGGVTAAGKRRGTSQFEIQQNNAYGQTTPRSLDAMGLGDANHRPRGRGWPSEKLLLQDGMGEEGADVEEDADQGGPSFDAAWAMESDLRTSADEELRRTGQKMRAPAPASARRMGDLGTQHRGARRTHPLPPEAPRNDQRRRRSIAPRVRTEEEGDLLARVAEDHSDVTDEDVEAGSGGQAAALDSADPGANAHAASAGRHWRTAFKAVNFSNAMMQSLGQLSTMLKDPAAVQVGPDGTVSFDLGDLLEDANDEEQDEEELDVAKRNRLKKMPVTMKQSQTSVIKEKGRMLAGRGEDFLEDMNEDEEASAGEKLKRVSFFIRDQGAVAAEDMTDATEDDHDAKESSAIGRRWRKARHGVGFATELMKSVRQVSCLLTEKGAEVEADGRVSFDLADLLADTDEDTQQQDHGEEQEEDASGELEGMPEAAGGAVAGRQRALSQLEGREESALQQLMYAPASQDAARRRRRQTYPMPEMTAAKAARGLKRMSVALRRSCLEGVDREMELMDNPSKGEDQRLFAVQEDEVDARMLNDESEGQAWGVPGSVAAAEPGQPSTDGAGKKLMKVLDHVHSVLLSQLQARRKRKSERWSGVERRLSMSDSEEQPNTPVEGAEKMLLDEADLGGAPQYWGGEMVVGSPPSPKSLMQPEGVVQAGQGMRRRAVSFTHEMRRSLGQLSTMLKNPEHLGVEAAGRVSFDLAELLADSDEDEEEQESGEDAEDEDLEGGVEAGSGGVAGRRRGLSQFEIQQNNAFRRSMYAPASQDTMGSDAVSRKPLRRSADAALPVSAEHSQLRRISVAMRQSQTLGSQERDEETVESAVRAGDGLGDIEEGVETEDAEDPRASPETREDTISEASTVAHRWSSAFEKAKQEVYQTYVRR